jgi:hypothetical protein
MPEAVRARGSGERPSVSRCAAQRSRDFLADPGTGLFHGAEDYRCVRPGRRHGRRPSQRRSVRGNVEIASNPGVGTTVALRLPLTLAIIDGQCRRKPEKCWTNWFPTSSGRPSWCRRSPLPVKSRTLAPNRSTKRWCSWRKVIQQNASASEEMLPLPRNSAANPSSW